ncbi:hypothetical protein ABEW81_26810 [Priestia megaterium]
MVAIILLPESSTSITAPSTGVPAELVIVPVTVPGEGVKVKFETVVCPELIVTPRLCDWKFDALAVNEYWPGVTLEIVYCP